MHLNEESSTWTQLSKTDTHILHTLPNPTLRVVPSVSVYNVCDQEEHGHKQSFVSRQRAGQKHH